MTSGQDAKSSAAAATAASYRPPHREPIAALLTVSPGKRIDLIDAAIAIELATAVPEDESLQLDRPAPAEALVHLSDVTVDLTPSTLESTDIDREPADDDEPGLPWLSDEQLERVFG